MVACNPPLCGRHTALPVIVQTPTCTNLLHVLLNAQSLGSGIVDFVKPSRYMLLLFLSLVTFCCQPFFLCLRLNSSLPVLCSSPWPMERYFKCIEVCFCVCISPDSCNHMIMQSLADLHFCHFLSSLLSV